MSQRRLPAPLRALGAAVVDLFPWTPLGTWLSLGAVFGLRHFAYEKLDLVWLVLGYAGLSLLLLAPLLVVPVAVYLRFRRTPELSAPPVAAEGWTSETGIARTTGFRMPTLRFVPLVDVRWVWRSPDQVRVRALPRGAWLTEQVTFEERGLFPGVVRAISVADVFGLCRIWISRAGEAPIRVLPALGALSRISTLSSFAAGDDLPHPRGLPEGDRLEISRYTPGDPVRFVHWKLLARTRQLLVRRPETALSTAQRVAAFQVAYHGDDATAAVARLAVTRGLLGAEFLFGTAEQPAGVADPTAALSLIVRSSMLKKHGARGAEKFFATAARSGPTAALLFVPPVPGPWLPEVVGLCQGRRMRVIIGVDQLVGAEPRSVWRRVLFAPARATGHATSDLDAVVRALRGAGCAVSVYDRPAGRLLSAAHHQPRTRPEAA